MTIDIQMNKEDVLHIYSGILFSHKKEWDGAICNNKDSPRDIILNEVGQTEKEKYHMISLTSGNYKKK